VKEGLRLFACLLVGAVVVVLFAMALEQVLIRIPYPF
jgi:F0F1-type ATP synthase membrane subunit a